MSQFTDDANEVLDRFREETLASLSSLIVDRINSSYNNVIASVEPQGKISRNRGIPRP